MPVDADEARDQMELFGSRPAIVHYFDRNGALRSGHLLRRITKGRHKGKPVVAGPGGKTLIPDRIRNIEYPD